MKRILFLFAVLVTVSFVHAQDTIYVKDGSVILTKKIEVGVSDLKYYPFGVTEYISHIIEKESVARICYQGGGIENFNGIIPIENYNIYNSVESDPTFSVKYDFSNTIERLETRRRRLNVWGHITFIYGMVNLIGGVSCFFLAMPETMDRDDARMYQTLGALAFADGVGCIILGSALIGQRNNTQQKLDAIRTSHVYGKNFNLGSKQLQMTADILNDTRNRQHGVGVGVSLSF